MPYFAVYGATKAYVLALSEALHEEARAAGVRVLALCPGPVPTEFQAIAGTNIGGVVRLVAASPEECVDQALAALQAARAIVVPRAANCLVAAMVGLLPRRAVRQLAGAVYRRRARH